MSRIECSVDGCSRPIHGRKDWCRRHNLQFWRTGSVETTLTARGEPERWLRRHSSYVGEACLIWPFSRTHKGRAQLRAASGNAPRLMCTIAHGEPPSSTHHAAHSCGKANDGCIHPGHLRWATPKENEADKMLHGTRPLGEKSNLSKLTIDQVVEIRMRARGGETQREIAEEFGVKQSCISSIKNKVSWAWL